MQDKEDLILIFNLIRFVYSILCGLNKATLIIYFKMLIDEYTTLLYMR